MTWLVTSGMNTLISDAGNKTNVVLDNGQGTVLRISDVPNDGSTASLVASVRAIIAARNAQGTQSRVTPGTVLDMSTPAQTPPTQAQIDQGNWLAAYTKVIRLQRAQAVGVSAITAQNVTDAQAALNALVYDPSYEALL